MTDDAGPLPPDGNSRPARPDGRADSLIGRSITDRLAMQQETAKPVRLRGYVREGVEHGSLILVDAQGVVLAQLLGGPGRPVPDAVGPPSTEMVVTGVFQEHLLTTGQQGRPFRVERVEPA